MQEWNLIMFTSKFTSKQVIRWCICDLEIRSWLNISMIHDAKIILRGKNWVTSIKNIYTVVLKSDAFWVRPNSQKCVTFRHVTFWTDFSENFGLNIEKCVRPMAKIFKNLDVRSSNHGFSATKLNKFQSEPTLETELSQEERILNLIESFDRFECSDSDNE